MEYEIKEVEANIFAVIIKDRYNRAMLFCKAQEYYESPNPQFQSKYFSIWDYIKWYSLTNKKGFTYPMDWSGFNIPLSVVKKCYSTKNPYRLETPYDKTMLEIVEKISKVKSSKPAYLIGTDSIKSETFLHETRHARYMVSPEYRKQIEKSLKRLKKLHPNEYKLLTENIVSMGYAKSVVEDEIQAYLQDITPDKDVLKGINNTQLKELKQHFVPTT
jgi:hypothetical protein